MVWYAVRAGETIPYIYTKRIYLDKGTFKRYIGSSPGYDYRVSTPSGEIFITPSGHVGIDMESMSITGGPSTFNNDIVFRAGSVLFSDGITSKGNTYVSGTLYLNQGVTKLDMPIASPYADAFVSEGHVATKTCVPSCATGYFKVQIGNVVGYVLMYSGLRMTKEES